MAGLKSPASHPILGHFQKTLAVILLPTPPFRSTSSSSSSFTCRPLLFPSTLLSLSSYKPPLHRPRSLSTSQPTLEPKIDENDDGNEEFEAGNEDFESEEELIVLESSLSTEVKELNTKSPSPLPLPSLTVKEKKELVSYAHSLGKKLKSQQVGKSGVTDSVGTALIETLEANELLKLKIHNSCPGELDDVVKQLEKATRSIVVDQIGRTVILYRPSLTKLQAEEKKKQNQTVFRRKQPTPKPSFQNRGQAPRGSGPGRGRRGSSRF